MQRLSRRGLHTLHRARCAINISAVASTAATADAAAALATATAIPAAAAVVTTLAAALAITTTIVQRYLFHRRLYLCSQQRLQ